MRYVILALFSTCLCLMSFSISYAQEVNQKTAETIKTKLVEMMSGVFSSMDDIDVKVMDDHYHISLDQNFKDEESGVSLILKGYEAKYYPTDDASQFEVESIIDKDNAIQIVSGPKEVEDFNIIEVKILGENKSARRALLDLDIGQYLSMHESIDKMQVTMRQGDVEKINMMIDNIVLIAKYNPSLQSDQKMMDGNMRAILKGVSGDIENPKNDKEKHKISIDSIVVDNAVRGWNPQSTKELQNKLVSNDNDFRFLDLFGAAKINASKMDIQGIKVSDMTGKPLFHLDNISYKGGASNINSDNAKMSFSMGFDGLLKTFLLSDDPTMVSLKSLIPDDMMIKFKANNLPILALEKEFQNEMDKQHSLKPETKPKQIIQQNKDKIIALLADNKASSTFNFDLGGEEFSLELQSNLTADKTSPLNVLGDVTLQFFNMDDYLKKAVEIGKSNQDNPLVAMNLPKAMGGIAMLQMFGQQKTDPDRGNYREYKVIFDETGNILLNGVPMSQVMGGMMGQPQKAQ